MTVSSFSSTTSVMPSQATVIAVRGELVRGAEDRILSDLMPSVHRESVALDLSSVERIDAAGIAVLITLYCTAMESGNGFYVVDPSPRVLDMLRLVGLESILIPAGKPDQAPETRRQRPAA